MFQNYTQLLPIKLLIFADLGLPVLTFFIPTAFKIYALMYSSSSHSTVFFLFLLYIGDNMWNNVLII